MGKAGWGAQATTAHLNGPVEGFELLGGANDQGAAARRTSVDKYLVVEGKGRIAGLPQMEKFYADFLFALARG